MEQVCLTFLRSAPRTQLWPAVNGEHLLGTLRMSSNASAHSSAFCTLLEIAKRLRRPVPL